MNATPGLVTTIIPVFNRAGMVREAVQSVLDQSWRPIEIIVVDDGSTDETPETIGMLETRHCEVLVVRQENRGPGAAREAGRRLAHGEFIQYLDSDDRLLPRKFELQVTALRAHPECGIAYGFTRHLDAGGLPIECTWKRANQIQDYLFPSFLVSRWWDTPAPLFRSSVSDAAGPWSDLRLEEDWEHDCRIAAMKVRLTAIPEFVCEVRDHPEHRLSRGTAHDAGRLRHRARAHELIYGHALRAGIDATWPEMRRFARELFLLARQCGAAGLREESRRLLNLASDAGAPDARWQYPLYRGLAGIFGWTTIGKASAVFDRLRRGAA